MKALCIAACAIGALALGCPKLPDSVTVVDPLDANWSLVMSSRTTPECRQGDKTLPCLFVTVSNIGKQSIQLRRIKVDGATQSGAAIERTTSRLLRSGQLVAIALGPFQCGIPYAIEVTSDTGVHKLELSPSGAPLPPPVLEACLEPPPPST